MSVDAGRGETMNGDRHDAEVVSSGLLQEYPHFHAHLDEVGDELGRVARWGYLAWVAFWLVALSLLAFATVVQGPVSF
jgi:hypothetical protein